MSSYVFTRRLFQIIRSSKQNVFSILLTCFRFSATFHQHKLLLWLKKMNVLIDNKKIRDLLNNIDKLQKEIGALSCGKDFVWSAIHEKLRYSWTYNSNAIEGSTLSEGETIFSSPFSVALMSCWLPQQNSITTTVDKTKKDNLLMIISPDLILELVK